MYEKILVCLDGRKQNEAILPPVKELAARFGSKVIFLEVIEKPSILPGLGRAEIELCEDVEFTTPEITASGYLENIVEAWRAEGLDAEGITIEGNIEDSVLACINAFDVDLVAVTARSRSAPGRAFLKSKTDFIIRKTGVLVLVICPLQTAVSNLPEKPDI